MLASGEEGVEHGRALRQFVAAACARWGSLLCTSKQTFEIQIMLTKVKQWLVLSTISSIFVSTKIAQT